MTDTTDLTDLAAQTDDLSQTLEDLFDTGLDRYKSGEAAATLIPTFKEVCDRSPKSSAAWTCLSWLYLLDSKPTAAYKAAKTAVKLNPQDPQARVNLAIAMLETAQKGVREHIDIAGQIMLVAPELKEEVEQNFEEALSRKPDWKSLNRVKTWLAEG
jgi:predicted Zn-dependent protease